MKSSKQQTSNSSNGNSEYWIRTGKQLTASALSGWTEALITYPAEYTKIMLQLQGGNGKPSSAVAEGVQPKKLTGAGDVVRSTLKNYGPLGLYRGFSIVFVGSVPKYMCRFGAYEQLKRLMADPNSGQQLTSGQKLLCGMGAGVIEALVAVIPIESTKVKFINDRLSETPKYRGLVSGVKEIVRERGLGAMYSGVTATVVKQASNQAVRFAVFESLKEWSGSKEDDNQKSTKKLYPVFGMAAGAASVLVNAPIDAVKTRLQSFQAGQYTGTVDCIVKVYQKEGVAAFYRGSLVRMFKCGAEVAIAFTTYNLIVDLIGA
ncbi:hypothetical protein TYRP_015297 [Tyrophagus putrescentiae]|nr:hypothetical protein TYRP_015297 [Tyrophagus putrescentiae]